MSKAFRDAKIDPKDRDAVSLFTAIDCSKDPSLTSQADRNEVDINRIVARIEKGLVVPVRNEQPFYGDVSDLGGLQDAIIKVQEAEELFMSYPAQIREKFDNDPIKMIDYLSDPNNKQEAIKLGIIEVNPNDKPVVEPVQVPVGTPTQ